MIKLNYVLLFPGQGSQYIGMCAEIIKRFKGARSAFTEASEVLGEDILALVMNGDMRTLTSTVNAQPAVVTAGVALYRAFCEEFGSQRPFAAVGHSLGEITALICSGALSFSEGIGLVRERSKIMQEVLNDKTGMSGLILDVPLEKLEEIMERVNKEQYAAISCYNSPRQFVIAGVKEAYHLIDEEIDHTEGEFVPFKMIPMKADAPYHSKCMEPMKERMEKLFQKITVANMQFSVISTVSGSVYQNSDDVRNNLVNQLAMSVLWTQVLESLIPNSNLMIEIGPGVTMRNLVLENKKLPMTLSYDAEEDRKKLTSCFLS